MRLSWSLFVFKSQTHNLRLFRAIFFSIIRLILKTTKLKPNSVWRYFFKLSKLFYFSCFKVYFWCEQQFFIKLFYQKQHIQYSNSDILRIFRLFLQTVPFLNCYCLFWSKNFKYCEINFLKSFGFWLRNRRFL